MSVMETIQHVLTQRLRDHHFFPVITMPLQTLNSSRTSKKGNTRWGNSPFVWGQPASMTLISSWWLLSFCVWFLKEQYPVTAKSSWAGGLSCVILSAPPLALACCPSVGIVSVYCTVAVELSHSWHHEEVLHQPRNYSNARPLSSHTIMRLLANNAYCYKLKFYLVIQLRISRKQLWMEGGQLVQVTLQFSEPYSGVESTALVQS